MALALPWVSEAMSIVTSTHIPDDELIKMAVFKLGETARRVALLAKEAETPRLRRLFAASSELIEKHSQELLVCLDAGRSGREPRTLPVTRSRERRAPRVRASRAAVTRAGAHEPRLAARG